MGHIRSIAPESLKPLQFAYRHSRLTEDAISFALYTTLPPWKIKTIMLGWYVWITVLHLAQ